MGVKAKRVGYMLLAVGVVAVGSAFGIYSIAKYKRLLAENGRLRAQLASLSAAVEASQPGPNLSKSATEPDVDVNIDELWADRFDDNQFRSRQHLADKLIRVTGKVDSLSENSVTLLGTTTRFGDARMRVNLKEDYAARVSAQLASLEVGSNVTVQGTFQFDRIWLNDAVFVDERSGEILSGQKIVDQNHLQHNHP